MATILDNIIQTKQKELELAKSLRPLAAVQKAAKAVAPPRDFRAAVTSSVSAQLDRYHEGVGPGQPRSHGATQPRSRDGSSDREGKATEPRRHDQFDNADRTSLSINLIAEIKRRSPSAGVIVADCDPVEIARTYQRAGAAAISVVTDGTYFGGSIDDLSRVRLAVPLPVLRKDFILEEYQVFESRAAGADAVLLIAEAIGPVGVAALLPVVTGLGMTALVEVHSAENLEAIVDRIGAQGERFILGINNRNLATQRTDLATTARLAAMLPPSTPFVAESGIASREDVLAVQRAGACAILVGEALLRAPDIARRMAELRGDL